MLLKIVLEILMNRIMEIIAKLSTQELYAKTVYIIRIIKLRDSSKQDLLSVNRVMNRVFKYLELLYVYS
jgi:hypothetical protein